jgi:hypothetical protein
MDFLVNLPSSALNDQKFNSFFVVEDMLSKQCHLIPTTTNVKAEGVAELYFDHIYRLHSLPRAIVSDRDTKFTGAFLEDIAEDGWDGSHDVYDGSPSDRRTK